MKKSIALGTLLLMAAGSASAALVNDRDPQVALDGSLQALLGTSATSGVINGYNGNASDVINAATDQSVAAIWNNTDSNSSAYLINLLGNTTGSLGIYSYANNSLQHTFVLDGTNQVSFEVFDNGTFSSTDGGALAGFGSTFGFFYNNGSTTVYTEDSRNPHPSGSDPTSNPLALSYLLPTGTNVMVDRGLAGAQSQTAEGDDWLLAFESTFDQNDFTDAVFYIEDMEAVSAPATLALMGLGLLGLAYRGKNKKA